MGARRELALTIFVFVFSVLGIACDKTGVPGLVAGRPAPKPASIMLNFDAPSGATASDYQVIVTALGVQLYPDEYYFTPDYIFNRQLGRFDTALIQLADFSSRPFAYDDHAGTDEYMFLVRKMDGIPVDGGRLIPGGALTLAASDYGKGKVVTARVSDEEDDPIVGAQMWVATQPSGSFIAQNVLQTVWAARLSAPQEISWIHSGIADEAYYWKWRTFTTDSGGLVRLDRLLPARMEATAIIPGRTTSFVEFNPGTIEDDPSAATVWKDGMLVLKSEAFGLCDVRFCLEDVNGNPLPSGEAVTAGDGTNGYLRISAYDSDYFVRNYRLFEGRGDFKFDGKGSPESLGGIFVDGHADRRFEGVAGLADKSGSGPISDGIISSGADLLALNPSLIPKDTALNEGTRIFCIDEWLLDIGADYEAKRQPGENGMVDFDCTLPTAPIGILADWVETRDTGDKEHPYVRYRCTGGLTLAPGSADVHLRMVPVSDG